MSKTKQRTVKFGTSDIAAAMRVKYPSNAYAVLFEVANATGFGCNRHADALVMSLWPSRGLHVTGFEFKASRSDWVKELKDPSKAEAVAQYCDYWTLAVADESIVKPGELPFGWGLMAVAGKTLKTITEPTRLEAKPWTREFQAAVLRSVAEPAAAIDYVALNVAREEGRKEAAETAERREKQWEKQFRDLLEKVSEFESSTGIAISNRWGGVDSRKVTLAMTALADGKHSEILNELRWMKDRTANIASTVKEQIEAIEAFASAKIGTQQSKGIE